MHWELRFGSDQGHSQAKVRVILQEMVEANLMVVWRPALRAPLSASIRVRLWLPVWPQGMFIVLLNFRFFCRAMGSYSIPEIASGTVSFYVLS